MKKLFLEIELLADTVLPVSSATDGPRQSLGYVPGSVLLGVAAARLYSRLGQDAFTVFHSGKVRFLPAYPVAADGSWSLPVPLSYHHEKDFEFDKLEHHSAYKLLPKEPDQSFRNLAQSGRLQRPKNLEGRFMTRSGLLFEPEKRILLKTAIDPETGRVDESKLFAYEALRAGTRLGTEIHLDDDVPAETADKLIDALTKGTVALGRSRSAEFGRAVITQVGQPEQWTLSKKVDGLLVYASSDLALIDMNTGNPSLEPRPEQFGLDFEVDWNHTFIRTRVYSPVNSKRRSTDLERQVIVAGSVIAFDTGGAQYDLGEIRKRLESGIGAYRADGLGQVLVQPGFLDHDMPHCPERIENVSLDEAKAPDDELYAWLQERRSSAARKERALELADSWFEEIKAHARKPNAPSKSAWSFVAQAAAMATSGTELKMSLLAKKGEAGASEAGLLRKGVRQDPWKVRHQGESLADRLGNLLDEEIKNSPEMVLPAVQMLAKRVIKHLSGQGKQ